VHLLVLAGPAWAAVYTVDPAGAGDFRDLPAAIAAAADGDTLSLAPGTYGIVEVVGRRLSIVAATPDTASLTAVDAVSSELSLHGVRFVDAYEPVEVLGGRVVLDSVQFTGGHGAAAVRVSDGGDLTLRRVRFDHVAAGLAPVLVADGRATVDTSEFEGGIGALAGAIAGIDAAIAVTATSFLSNHSDEGAGAISADGGALTLRASDFSGNVGTEGGAVWIAGGELDGQDTIWTDNTADVGGQLCVRDGAAARLTRSWFTGGLAETGGQIAILDSSLSATNLVLHQGEAIEVGGGLFLAGGSATVRYAAFQENAAGIGGGIATDDGAVHLEGAILAHNLGGDIANAGVTPVVASWSLLEQGGGVTGAMVAGHGVRWGGPAYTNPDAGELWLGSTSPGLDAGPRGEVDLDGTQADMGAFGGPSAWTIPDRDGDGEVAGRDCDDDQPAVHLGAPELWYDGIDQDCAQDDDFDQDGDGWRSFLYGGSDCDDVDPDVYPGATAAPGDSGDVNCDGLYGADADGDGWPAGVDCDDTDEMVFPGAPDTWYDGTDSDCSGGSDLDQDGDGRDRGTTDCDDADPRVYAGAPETVGDGVDQDCDGSDPGLADNTPAVTVAEAQAATPEAPNARMVTRTGCDSSSQFGIQGLAALLAVLALTGSRRAL